MTKPDDIPMPAWSAAKPVYDELFRLGKFWDSPVPFNPQEIIARALVSAEKRGREAVELKAVKAARLCPHWLGEDREIGPLGCRVDPCACSGIVTALRSTDTSAHGTVTPLDSVKWPWPGDK